MLLENSSVYLVYECFCIYYTNAYKCIYIYICETSYIVYIQIRISQICFLDWNCPGFAGDLHNSVIPLQGIYCIRESR